MDTPTSWPATHPHAWRIRFMEGYSFTYARGGMRHMPELLYGVAMHIAHSDMNDQLQVEYSPRTYTQFAGTVDSVRLAVRVLVALGYLKVIRAPRAPHAGIYQLMIIREGASPNIDAAFDLLESEGWTNKRSRNTDKATQARKARKSVSEGSDGTREAVDNPAAAERPIDRHDGPSIDRHDGPSIDRHDGLSLPIGVSGTDGITDLPEVTTDPVHIPSARERGLVGLDGGRANEITIAIRARDRSVVGMYGPPEKREIVRVLVDLADEQPELREMVADRLAEMRAAIRRAQDPTG